MVLQKSYSYTDQYPSVLARGGAKDAPRSFLLDPTKVTPWNGADGLLQRLVAPGTFVGTTATAGKFRPLPRTKLGAALVASTTATFAVGEYTARHFVAGDVLSPIPPYAVYTVTATWAANDTAIVTIDGRAVTVTAADGVAANIAIQIADALNADRVVGRLIRAVASGAAVFVYARDMISTYPIATGGTRAGNGTLPITGSLTNLATGSSFGTVLSVDPEADTVTLAAASSLSLPATFPVGVATSVPYDAERQGYGMLSPTVPMDLEWAENTIHGACTNAEVYGQRLPYWDGELAALFPQIKLV